MSRTGPARVAPWPGAQAPTSTGRRTYARRLTHGSQYTFPLLLALGIAWLLFTTALIASDAVLGVSAGLAPVVLFALLKSGAARVVAVVAGGMFVLGSSSDLSGSKFAYAGLVVFVAAVSAWRLATAPPPFARAFRVLLPWGVAFAGTMIVSFLATPGGSSVTTFGRQSIFYLLVILGPVIGLDAGRELKPKLAYPIIGVVGVVAAVGFAFDWLDRRGVSSLPIGRFVVSSLVLPAFAFSLALVLVFHSSGVVKRLLWTIAVLAVPVAMLVTGTRTNLVIFGAIPAVVGRLRNFRVPPLRLAIYIGASGIVGVGLFQVVASTVIQDQGFIAERIQAALTVLFGDAGADLSYSYRSEQYATATEMIRQSPLWGFGLGYAINFTIDSPLLSVVRLGWVGVTVIVSFLIALSIAVFRSARADGRTPAHVAYWGFAVVALANLPFGTPLEDRGFGFAIMLATTAIGSALAHPSQPRPERAPRESRALATRRRSGLA